MMALTCIDATITRISRKHFLTFLSAGATTPLLFLGGSVINVPKDGKRGIHRSAYDALYDKDWQYNGIVELSSWKECDWDDLMEFAQYMSHNLGFRLKVTFPYPNSGTVRFRRVS
jgi:hypothetical protein